MTQVTLFDLAPVRSMTPRMIKKKRPPLTITARGQTLSATQWANVLGISASAIRDRKRMGWSDESCLLKIERFQSVRVVREGIDEEITRDLEDLPWAEDHRAWYVVACHRHGLDLGEVGALFGISRERVRQIEETALVKFRVVQELFELLGKRGERLAYALQGLSVHHYEAALVQTRALLRGGKDQRWVGIEMVQRAKRMRYAAEDTAARFKREVAGGPEQ